MRGRKRREGREGGREKGREGKGGEGGRTTLRTPCRKFLATPLVDRDHQPSSTPG